MCTWHFYKIYLFAFKWSRWHRSDPLRTFYHFARIIPLAYPTLRGLFECLLSNVWVLPCFLSHPNHSLLTMQVNSIGKNASGTQTCPRGVIQRPVAVSMAQPSCFQRSLCTAEVSPCINLTSPMSGRGIQFARTLCSEGTTLRKWQAHS